MNTILKQELGYILEKSKQISRRQIDTHKNRTVNILSIVRQQKFVQNVFFTKLNSSGFHGKKINYHVLIANSTIFV